MKTQHLRAWCGLLTGLLALGPMPRTDAADVVLPGQGGDATYPQTAIGHTADHRLILFVSDGRQPEFSAGMTYGEVAIVLKEFGAIDAIAFDGGGSATLVMTDGKTGEPRVLNRPSDGQERSVGNNLAIVVPASKSG